MSQIIISNLEISQELDREALNGVLGGKRRKGRCGRKNFHHQVSYYREEYYSSSHHGHHGHYGHHNYHNHCHGYNPHHFNYFHC